MKFHQVKYTETDVKHVWYDGYEFWFSDETGDFNGPYQTKNEAKAALSLYIANML